MFILLSALPPNQISCKSNQKTKLYSCEYREKFKKTSKLHCSFHDNKKNTGFTNFTNDSILQSEILYRCYLTFEMFQLYQKEKFKSQKT